MAEGLFTGKEIEFADGQTRLVKPLTISQLRKFVKAIEGLDVNATTLKDEDIDRMLAAVKIVLEKRYPDLCGDEEAFEEAIDIANFQAILSIAMGNDPNA